MSWQGVGALLAPLRASFATSRHARPPQHLVDIGVVHHIARMRSQMMMTRRVLLLERTHCPPSLSTVPGCCLNNLLPQSLSPVSNGMTCKSKHYALLLSII